MTDENRYWNILHIQSTYHSNTIYSLRINSIFLIEKFGDEIVTLQNKTIFKKANIDKYIYQSVVNANLSNYVLSPEIRFGRF